MTSTSTASSGACSLRKGYAVVMNSHHVMAVFLDPMEAVAYMGDHALTEAERFCNPTNHYAIQETQLNLTEATCS